MGRGQTSGRAPRCWHQSVLGFRARALLLSQSALGHLLPCCFWGGHAKGHTGAQDPSAALPAHGGSRGDAADSPSPPQPRGRGFVPTRTSGPFRLTALWGCPGPISAPLVGSSWGSHLLTEHCPAAPCPVGRGLRSGAKQSSPASAEPASHVALYPGMLLQREMQGAAPARHSQSGLSILMW